MRLWTGANNMKRFFVTPAGKSSMLNTFDSDTSQEFGYRKVKEFIEHAEAHSYLTPPGHFVLFYNNYVEHAGVIAPEQEWGADTRFPKHVLPTGTLSLAADIDVIQEALFKELRREARAEAEAEANNNNILIIINQGLGNNCNGNGDQAEAQPKKRSRSRSRSRSPGKAFLERDREAKLELKQKQKQRNPR